MTQAYAIAILIALILMVIGQVAYFFSYRLADLIIIAELAALAFICAIAPAVAVYRGAGWLLDAAAIKFDGAVYVQFSYGALGLAFLSCGILGLFGAWGFFRGSEGLPSYYKRSVAATKSVIALMPLALIWTLLFKAAEKDVAEDRAAETEKESLLNHIGKRLMSSPNLRVIVFNVLIFLLMKYAESPWTAQLRANAAITDFANQVSEGLCKWAAKHHTFPRTEQEFVSSVAEFFKGEIPVSPYKRGKDAESVLYRLKCIENASATYVAPRGEVRAATMYYAVSNDLRQYWLSVIRLDGFAGYGGECRWVDENTLGACDEAQSSDGGVLVVKSGQWHRSRVQ